MREYFPNFNPFRDQIRNEYNKRFFNWEIIRIAPEVDGYVLRLTSKARWPHMWQFPFYGIELWQGGWAFLSYMVSELTYMARP